MVEDNDFDTYQPRRFSHLEIDFSFEVAHSSSACSDFCRAVRLLSPRNKPCLSQMKDAKGFPNKGSSARIWGRGGNVCNMFDSFQRRKGHEVMQSNKRGVQDSKRSTCSIHCVSVASRRRCRATSPLGLDTGRSQPIMILEHHRCVTRLTGPFVFGCTSAVRVINIFGNNLMEGLIEGLHHGHHRRSESSCEDRCGKDSQQCLVIDRRFIALKPQRCNYLQCFWL